MGTERCNNCTTVRETKDLKRCTNCKVAFYCSKECQKMHWKAIHRASCSVLRATNGKRVRESPKEKAWSKKIGRWITAWSSAINSCALIALDLANHERGRHDTHSLVIVMEHTGLDEDAQLFRLTDARIERTADIIKARPDLEHATINPPGFEWPRLYCFFFFKDKDPTKPDRARALSWCMTNLREACYEPDKDYSHAVSKLAMGVLLDEGNVLQGPQHAEQLFRLMVTDPDLSWALLEMVENDDDELLRQFLGIGPEGEEGNGGSES